MLAATLSPQSPNLGNGKSSLLILVLHEGWARCWGGLRGRKTRTVPGLSFRSTAASSSSPSCSEHTHPPAEMRGGLTSPTPKGCGGQGLPCWYCPHQGCARGGHLVSVYERGSGQQRPGGAQGRLVKHYNFPQSP